MGQLAPESLASTSSTGSPSGSQLHARRRPGLKRTKNGCHACRLKRVFPVASARSSSSSDVVSAGFSDTVNVTRSDQNARGAPKPDERCAAPSCRRRRPTVALLTIDLACRRRRPRTTTSAYGRQRSFDLTWNCHLSSPLPSLWRSSQWLPSIQHGLRWPPFRPPQPRRRPSACLECPSPRPRQQSALKLNTMVVSGICHPR